jgi:hypothetical protein
MLKTSLLSNYAIAKTLGNSQTFRLGFDHTNALLKSGHSKGWDLAVSPFGPNLHRFCSSLSAHQTGQVSPDYNKDISQRDLSNNSDHKASFTSDWYAYILVNVRPTCLRLNMFRISHAFHRSVLLLNFLNWSTLYNLSARLRNSGGVWAGTQFFYIS